MTAQTFSQIEKEKGIRYDGELANAFAGLSLDFWLSHERERQEVTTIFRATDEQYPDSVQRSIDTMLRRRIPSERLRRRASLS